MRHLWAILIKFAAVGTVILSIYGIFNIDVTILFIMSLLTTLIAYFVGDLIILRKYGNVAAILGDLVLTFGLLWLMSFLLIDTPVNQIASSLISAISITAVDVLFHLYVKNHIFKNTRESTFPTVTSRDQFATEFSKELHDHKPKTED